MEPPNIFKTDRSEAWIQTYTRRKFYPLDPRSDDVSIVDIAHALSNLCRYSGHTRSFYSVAQHSVLMADAVDTYGDKRWALLHDAPEAYLCDVPGPIKKFFPEFQVAEDRIMRAIATRFVMHTAEIPDTVKAADRAILKDECAYLMNGEVDDWGIPGQPLGIRIETWGPAEAEMRFLRAARRVGLQ